MPTAQPPEIITFAPDVRCRPPVTVLPGGFLHRKAAATYVRSTRWTLKRWEAEGRGPRFTRVGQLCIYAITDLDHWLAAGGNGKAR